MKKKSTQFSTETLTSVASEEAAVEVKESPAGSPRQSTLDLIRQFARCYHYDNPAFPVGIILN